jgi:hypothetical protein
MNTLAKVAALAAVLCTPVAFARDYPNSQTTPSSDASKACRRDSAKLDANGDGNISKRSERRSDAGAKFDKLDADKSGSLSATEIRK